MSRIHRVLFIFLLLPAIIHLGGCRDEKPDKVDLDAAVIDQETNRSVADIKQEEAVSEEDRMTLEEYLSMPYIGDPVAMYINNKKTLAQSKGTHAFMVNSTSSKGNDYHQSRKIDRVRDFYAEGDERRAFMEAQKLLRDQALSPMTRAELLFMMGDISRKNSLDEEALEFIGSSYEAMKEIPDHPEIKMRTSNYNELLATFSDINEIELYGDEEQETVE
ncbi:MAG: hypothetical protein ACOCWO_00210 [Candidatus Muiribacteriaceae bacterium]